MYPDIYFEPTFSKLYESIERGKAVNFVVESNDGRVENNFIIREIPNKIDGKTYYDITTAYGYGGPVITSLTGNKKELLKTYYQEMNSFVSENDVVSEFIRFHPIIENAIDFSELYETSPIRKVVMTTIHSSNTFEKEFSKSARKSVRKAIKNGLTYRVKSNPNNLDSFLEIYVNTMERNGAEDYYYFGEHYFKNLIEKFGKHLFYVEVLFENRVVAASVNFVYNDIAHVHLSGSLSEYIDLSTAYLLKFAQVEWCENNGIKLLNYGGGTSNKENDSLYLFKKKFSKSNNEKWFYVGKKIWNEKVYRELSRHISNSYLNNFFPLYRLK